MAQDEGDGPKRSSWHTWVRGSARRRIGERPLVAQPAPSPPPAADDPSPFDEPTPVEQPTPAEQPTPVGEPTPVEQPTPADDLDVTLSWPGGDAAGDDNGGADRSGDDHVAAVPGPRLQFDGLDDFDDEPGGAAGDDGDLLPVPLLPTIAGRVDALGAMLRTIAMRVDSLAATTNAFRSAVTDRIDEYADVVAGLGRQGEQTLDDYRRASERQVGELRRGLADHDELLHRASGRLDELATDVATLIDLVRLGVSDQRAGLAAMSPSSATLVPDLTEELDSVKHDLGYLRGMVDVIVDTMPASADGSAGPTLSDAEIDRIVDRLAARLEAEAPSPPETAFAPPPPPPPPAPPKSRSRSTRKR